MSTMATVRINTSARMVLYRDFIIQEAYDTAIRKDVWEWTHENFGRRDRPHNDITGDCQTMFEAIDAIEAWYEQSEAA